MEDLRKILPCSWKFCCVYIGLPISILDLPVEDAPDHRRIYPYASFTHYSKSLTVPLQVT
jgi:hypothetical protein